MSEIQLIPGGATPETSESESATVTIALTSVGPGQLGPVLDEIAGLARRAVRNSEGGIEGSVVVPGWHEVFYGWERDDR